MPSDRSTSSIQRFLNAGRDYETWTNDFVSDLYAVRSLEGREGSGGREGREGREGLQQHADCARTVVTAGRDNPWDAEVEERDAAAVRARQRT